MQRGGGTREGKDEAARDKITQGYPAEQHTDGVHNERRNAGKSGFELRCRIGGSQGSFPRLQRVLALRVSSSDGK